jgi:hypothetical protein
VLAASQRLIRGGSAGTTPRAASAGRPAAAAATDATAASEPTTEEHSEPGFELVCPICTQQPFHLARQPIRQVQRVAISSTTHHSRGPTPTENLHPLANVWCHDCSRLGLSCPRCGRTFAGDAAYLDLTLTSGAPPSVYQRQSSWPGTQIFRSGLVSFVYERGWRQGFATYGFPGPDKEFDLGG